MKTPEHLGGHCGITHIDKGSLEWAIKSFNIKSFLDIGCGPGGMVKEALFNYNLDALGIDGDFNILKNSKNFMLHDFTKSAFVPEKTYDLVWSCEFVEHVEEKYFENYIQTFKSGKYIILTHAPPGTPGIHHVNCKPKDYWIENFLQHNLIYDHNITVELKNNSSMKRNFIRENGLFFINKNEERNLSK